MAVTSMRRFRLACALCAIGGSSLGIAASAAAPSAAKEPDETELMSLAKTQAAIDSCTAVIPDFPQRHATVYNKWRAQNKAALARFMDSERHQGIRMETARKFMAHDTLEMRTAYCENVLVRNLRNSVRDREVRGGK